MYAKGERVRNGARVTLGFSVACALKPWQRATIILRHRRWARPIRGASGVDARPGLRGRRPVHLAQPSFAGVAASVPRTGVGSVRLDDSGQQFPQRPPLGFRQTGGDLGQGSEDRWAQTGAQGQPAGGEAQRARPSVCRSDLAVHEAESFETPDDLVCADRVDAHPLGQAALVYSRRLVERAEDAVFQRRKVLGSGYLGELAEADLMETACEVGLAPLDQRYDRAPLRRSGRGIGRFAGDWIGNRNQ